MTGSVYEMIQAAADRCDWSNVYITALLLDYIDQQQSDEAFGDYLEARIAEEMEDGDDPEPSA